MRDLEVVGVLIVALLTVVLSLLKLTDVIDWAWVWVLSPLWIYAILRGFVFLIIDVD